MTHMVEKIADCLVEDHVELMNENQRLKRENSILRRELKFHLSMEHWKANPGMSNEEADRLAERDIVHLIAHNEGAE